MNDQHPNAIANIENSAQNEQSVDEVGVKAPKHFAIFLFFGKYKKWLLLGVALLIILLLGMSIYYSRKRSSSIPSRVVQTAISPSPATTDNMDKQPFVLKSTESKTYKNDLLGIKFDYPIDLYLYDLDKNGNAALVRIFFEETDDPFTVNDCKTDCITFGSFLRENVTKNMNWTGANYYDNELKDLLGASFPIYDYPKYLYKAINYEIKQNQYTGKRYYRIGPNMISAGMGKKPGNDYLVEELVYLEDPYIEDRIFYIQYQEVKDILPVTPKSTNAQAIGDLFDLVKIGIFDQIIASLEIFPARRDEFIAGKVNEQKIAFEYPRHWGMLVEEKRSNTLYEGERLFLSFKSSVDIYTSPTRMSFDAHNKDTASFVYEAFLGYLAKYSGQSIEDFCKNNGYLNQTGSYDVEVAKCEVVTLANGIKIGLVEGNYAAIFAYGNGEIPEEERNYEYFKVASVKTKSTNWPGLSITLSGSKQGITSEEADFNHIINSFKYIE